MPSGSQLTRAKLHKEPRALAFPVRLCPDFAAVKFHKVFGNVETEAGAAHIGAAGVFRADIFGKELAERFF